MSNDIYSIKWANSILHVIFARAEGVFLVCLASLLLLTACEGGRPNRGKGSAVSANSIVFTLGNDISNMDPAQMNDIESVQVAAQVYEGLVRFKHGSVDVEPCLATEWSVSDDGLEWTFKLREGVHFQDGSPLTAESVVISVQRQMQDTHPYHVKGRMRYAGLLFGDSSSTATQLVTAVQAVDQHTVKFILARPYMPFLQNLAMTQAVILSTESLKKLGNDINTTMVGTGAFSLKTYKRDQRITVTRNPGYWGPRAHLDEIEFLVLRDPNTRLNSLRRGNSDVISGIEPYSVGLLEDDDNVSVLSEPSMNIGYIALNCAEPPLDNPKVRHALNYAIDKAFLSNILFNKTSVEASGIIPPGMLGYDETRSYYSHDPDKARQLLKEAGYLNGFRIVFSTHNKARMYSPVGVRLAERIQQDLAAVGVTAELDQMEFPTFLERQKSREFAMANGGWISDNGDPDNFLFELVGREDNNLNYVNPPATALMRNATGEKDPAKRAEMYKAAEKLVMEAPPMIPLNHAKQTMAIRRTVQNFIMHPTGVNRLDSVVNAKP